MRSTPERCSGSLALPLATVAEPRFQPCSVQGYAPQAAIFLTLPGQIQGSRMQPSRRVPIARVLWQSSRQWPV